MSQLQKHTPTQGKPSYPALLAQLQALTADLQELREQGIAALAPVVQDLVRSGSRDVQRIEHTLDQLLDVACLPEGLALFKTLCCHYWTLDPQATPPDRQPVLPVQRLVQRQRQTISPTPF